MSIKPVLVIMAAGMGSRYGGLKQIDPVDPYGNMIIDFSIYDAKQAGFEKVIFIIKKAIDEAFREGIGKRIKKYMDVEYVYQELDVLPKGYEVQTVGNRSCDSLCGRSHRRRTVRRHQFR